jgi:hypothetical protein
MALTTTNAQISIQDGPLPAVNLISGTSIGLFTPGATVTFALQSTTGIARAEYTLICPRYPGLHQNTFVWTPGQVNAFTVVMPANTEVSSASTLSGILVAVTVSDGVSGIASAANYIESKTGGDSIDFQMAADYVIVAALPAYTNTAGSLLGNANGAITSTMADGVTPAVGDTFLLPPGIAGAAVDVGLYVITAVGAAGAKFSAVQASSWQQSAIIPNKAEILIARGTVFAGTTWVVTNTGSTNAVGTASFTLYPRAVFQSVTLSASGNRAITNVPILSATQSLVVCDKTASGGTVTSTIRYETAAAPTPGALGTATTTVQASVAAGTANTADQSVLTVGIFNQV